MQIVLATCHSSGGRQLRYHDFDVVIIDEATQALEAVIYHVHCRKHLQHAHNILFVAGLLDTNI